MALDYLVTYAGIPLVSDAGTNAGTRLPASYKPYGQEDDPRLPTYKQQPLTDLVAEVNRLMDLGYIQDQAYPFPTQDKKTADLAKKWPINQWYMPQLKIGDYFYPYGMSRWSIYRGLATSSQVKAILNTTAGTGAWPFILSANPISPNNPNNNVANYTIKTYLYMLPPRPLAEHGGGLDGLFLITLVDERYYWNGATFTYHPNNNATWEDLLSQLITLFNITVAYEPQAPAPYLPEVDSQLWSNEVNAAFLFDIACHNIGGVAVRNLTGLPEFSYNIYQPWKSRDIAYMNRGAAAQVVRTAGGDMFNHGGDGQLLPSGPLTASINSVLPKAVKVTFPKYVMGNDPVPHFVNPRYQHPRSSCWYEDDYGDVFTQYVPLLSGGLQFSGTLGVFISGSLQLDANGNPYVSSGLVGTQDYATIHCTAKALYSGEAQAVSGGVPLNLQGLIPIAQQLAYDVFTEQIAVALDETYPGTFLWQPEGIHDVVWRISDRLREGTTRVLRAQWNVPLHEVQEATPLPSNYASVPGVGGPSVAQSWRDSYSGSFSTTLAGTLSSGATSLLIGDPSYLPTQNRWKARINSGQADDETVLLEGTSGGTTVGIVQQGVDGSIPTSHANGSVVQPVTPDTVYGVNSVRFDKGQFVYFDDWKSGGVQGVVVVPQTQTVRVLDGTGTPSPGGNKYYSGQVIIADKSQQTFQNLEYVWVMERNGNPVNSGYYYDGQLFSYSTQPSYNPVYLVNQPTTQAQVTSGVPWTAGYVDNSLLVSGMKLLRFDGSGFILSGYPQSGGVDVYHYYGVSGDIKPIGIPGSPGVLGKVARADHIHPASGSILSGMIVSGAVNIYNFILVSGQYTSGIILETLNQDGSQLTYPTALMVAANSYSGQQHGRIVFTNLGNGLISGTDIISGITKSSGLSGSWTWGTQIDWQGQRVYHQGNAWFGPMPDLQIVDTDTVTWSGGLDSGTRTITLRANRPLTVENTDGSNIISGTKLIEFNNTLGSGYQFGRLYESPLSGSTTQCQIDWQGLRVYHAGDGYHGPEPDLEMVDTTPGINWTVLNDTGDQRVQIEGYVNLYPQDSASSTQYFLSGYPTPPVTVNSVSLPAGGTWLVWGQVTAELFDSAGGSDQTVTAAFSPQTHTTSVASEALVVVCLPGNSSATSNIGSATLAGSFLVASGQTGMVDMTCALGGGSASAHAIIGVVGNGEVMTAIWAAPP